MDRRTVGCNPATFATSVTKRGGDGTLKRWVVFFFSNYFINILRVYK